MSTLSLEYSLALTLLSITLAGLPRPVQSCESAGCGIQVERAVAPQLPSIAYHAGINGSALVEVLIDDSGSVTNARLVGGHPLLREIASFENTARRWRFCPSSKKREQTPRKALISFVLCTVLTGDPEEEFAPVFAFRTPYTFEVLYRQAPGHTNDDLGKD